MRDRLSAKATWRTLIPEILAIGGGAIAFFFLADSRGLAALLGLPAGIIAAMAARSTVQVTFDPPDMTPQEKRRLLGPITSPLVIVGLGILVIAFLVPAEWLRWRPPSLINYAPQVKAVLAYLGAFLLGIGLTIASAAGRPVPPMD